MSFEVTQISIAMFSIFLGVSTWYLTGDVLPAFISIVIAGLMVLSYLYYYKFNQFRLNVNVNPNAEAAGLVPESKKRKKR